MGNSFWTLFSFALIFSTQLALGTYVDPEVKKALRRNSNSISVLVNLDGQYDLKSLETFHGTAEAKVKETANRLEAFHQKNAQSLLSLLRSANMRTEIEEVSPLWITNSLRVKGSAAAIQKILRTNGIESVMLDAPKEVDIDQTLEGGASLANPSHSALDETQIGWGVQKVRAPEAWATGITGKGIVVAVIDSGANLTHPELAPNLWQNPGETGLDANGKDKATNGIDDDGNGYVDDVVGWNFEKKTNKPEDVQGHGSQTAGLVGGAGLGTIRTGVAPEVKMMILRSCCDAATQAFESNTWEAIQYAMKNGARIISMSLSVKHPSNPSYAKWRKVGEVELAAGMIHINSAGNRGNLYLPHNIGAPASNPPPYFHPMQVPVSNFGPTATITIGATDDKDVIRSYSSTGPVTWEDISEYKDYPYDGGAKPGLIRPDICGPSEVPSTSMTGTGYTTGFGGTSSATPQVAGVAALVLSAVPHLTPAQMLEALAQTAVFVENDFNNKCGAGRVDVIKAIEYAKAHF